MHENYDRVCWTNRYDYNQLNKALGVINVENLSAQQMIDAFNLKLNAHNNLERNQKQALRAVTEASTEDEILEKIETLRKENNFLRESNFVLKKQLEKEQPVTRKLQLELNAHVAVMNEFEKYKLAAMKEKAELEALLKPSIKEPIEEEVKIDRAVRSADKRAKPKVQAAETALEILQLSNKAIEMQKAEQSKTKKENVKPSILSAGSTQLGVQEKAEDEKVKPRDTSPEVFSINFAKIMKKKNNGTVDIFQLRQTYMDYLREQREAEEHKYDHSTNQISRHIIDYMQNMKSS